MNAKVNLKNLKMSDVDFLLMDVAIRIQLPPTSYKLATDRYGVIQEYLERDGSPLKGRIARMYPQGSMAIGATIASKVDNDEFDIDIVVELKSPAGQNPTAVLDLLFEALNGEPGSRYHGKVNRMTRCVQLQYENMHMDLTPAELLPAEVQRTSYIYHSKVDKPPTLEKRLVANPWGLANWFNGSTPYNAEFAREFRQRLNRGRVIKEFAEAAADPVPAQHDPKMLSTTVLALQLMKRWRNLRYANKPEGTRKPTSVALSRIVAGAEAIPYSLHSELLRQTTKVIDIFSASQAIGRVVHITNPTCGIDVLTDRWPGNLQTQQEFIDELREFITDLRTLSDSDIEEQQEILTRLFGETPAKQAVVAFTESRMDAANAATFQAPAPTHCKPVPWPAAGAACNVNIEGWQFNKNRQPLSLRLTRHMVPKGRRLEFKATTTVAPPYQVFWQVVNNGADAIAAKGLRGGFEESGGSQKLTKEERTSYLGNHWIECFIVKDGYLMARSGRYAVIIQ
ncbi:MAG TPA: nucleotidyltransferase [Gammaproteobacteria bacterium]|jgi:hypothetical protein